MEKLSRDLQIVSKALEKLDEITGQVAEARWYLEIIRATPDVSQADLTKARQQYDKFIEHQQYAEQVLLHLSGCKDVDDARAFTEMVLAAHTHVNELRQQFTIADQVVSVIKGSGTEGDDEEFDKKERTLRMLEKQFEAAIERFDFFQESLNVAPASRIEMVKPTLVTP